MFPKLEYEFKVHHHDVRETIILKNAVTYVSTANIPFDCLIVFVGAHGDSDYLYLQDGSLICVEEIVDLFLPRNCPALADKRCSSSKTVVNIHTHNLHPETHTLKNWCTLQAIC